jgi:hypothetical protein
VIEGKRSTTSGEIRDQAPIDSSTPGVGARQEAAPPPPGRGGYQDVCTGPGDDVASGASSPARAIATPDPRIADLRRMGLNRAWLRVAELIGFEDFLAVWRALENEAIVASDRGRIFVPKFATYLRFQRNRMIEELAARGMSAQEIQAHLVERTGEGLHEIHIGRLMQRGKVAAS